MNLYLHLQDKIVVLRSEKEKPEKADYDFNDKTVCFNGKGYPERCYDHDFKEWLSQCEVITIAVLQEDNFRRFGYSYNGNDYAGPKEFAAALKEAVKIPAENVKIKKIPYEHLPNGFLVDHAFFVEPQEEETQDIFDEYRALTNNEDAWVFYQWIKQNFKLTRLK